MKKILSGILGLFLVVGIVAGAGYALFSDTVSINGMVLGTATPNLLIRTDETGLTDWSPTLNFGNNPAFAPLLPGEYDWGEFYLWNNSNGTTDLLNLDITARLTAAGGDWGLLKDAIQLKVCIFDGAAANNCGATATGWMTLAQWNAAARTLPGNPLEQNTTEHYTLVFFIDPSFTNTIAGKSITDMSFEIIGTQIP